MAYFMRSGARYNVATKESMDLHEALPAGTYTAHQNPLTGQYYLEKIEGFKIENKLYGKTERHAERILSTFMSRVNSTGALLSGEKGSGKTLLAKVLSARAEERGWPTIVINQAHYGEAFNAFMQSIEQPTVVLFDEFEKVYAPEEQEQLLTLLDGVYPSKKLFVLTCNDRYRVDAHMKNRPGRIFYRLDFTGLDVDFVREYCEDNLNNKGNIDSVCRVSLLFGQFNFDMLKALVEEMNRYNETAQEALEMLNAKPENDDSAHYEVELFVGGVKNKHINSWLGNPLRGDVIVFHIDDPDDEDKMVMVQFRPVDFVSLDAASGRFEFKNAYGDRLVLKRQRITVHNYDVY